MKIKLLGTILVFLVSCSSLIGADSIYKIEDLYAKNSELNGKSVEVKGKIIKISSAIMGKDWIHVQDSSKNLKKNEVIFTAKMGASNVKIGDIVIAKGTLKANVDLGSGYFYKVLVEKSTFEK